MTSFLDSSGPKYTHLLSTLSRWDYDTSPVLPALNLKCPQLQGVVTPIDTVVTAATGVKKQSRGQRLFLATVKWSRTIFKLGKVVKMQFWMVQFLWPLTSGTVNNQVL